MGLDNKQSFKNEHGLRIVSLIEKSNAKMPSKIVKCQHFSLNIRLKMITRKGAGEKVQWKCQMWHAICNSNPVQYGQFEIRVSIYVQSINSKKNGERENWTKVQRYYLDVTFVCYSFSYNYRVVVHSFDVFGCMFQPNNHRTLATLLFLFIYCFHRVSASVLFLANRPLTSRL